MFDQVSFIMLIVLWPLCFLLIGMILLQGGAGDISSAFGGGGQLDSTLGVGAGRKMSKVTGWMTGAFLVIVAVLAVPHGTIGRVKTSSVEASATVGGQPAEDTIGSPDAAPEVMPVAPVSPEAAAPADKPAAPAGEVNLEASSPEDAAPVPEAAAPVPAAEVAPEAAAPAPQAAPAVEGKPEAEAAAEPEKRASKITLDE